MQWQRYLSAIARVSLASTLLACETRRLPGEPWQSPQELLFREDFERGTLDAFFPIGCCTHSHTLEPSVVRSGQHAVRVELRLADSLPGHGHRSELRITDGSIVGGVGDERWYAVSIYVPNDWRVDTNLQDWQIPIQWHSLPDVELGEGWLPPPLAIWIDKGEWSIWNYWDPQPVTQPVDGAPPPPGGRAVLWRGPYERGRWTDWVVHARWSYGNDGLLEIWRDGEKVVTKNGPNTYNDLKPLYFMVGLYRWPWDFPNTAWSEPTRVIYFDDVRIADHSASYADVTR